MKTDEVMRHLKQDTKNAYPLNSIHNIDCLDGMKNLKEGSIDLILTDPPYGISRENNLHTMRGHNGIDFGEWDKDVDLTSWIPHAVKLLKPGGSIIIFHDWRKLGIISSAVEACGCNVKDPILWQKNNPMPRNRDRRYVLSCEFAFWAVKKGKKDESWVFNRQDNGYENGVFNYPLVPNSKRIHPTQKPVQLFKDLIRIHSCIGDTVLDPFMGSGTTAVACLGTDRKYIGFERDAEHYDNAQTRIEEAVAETKPQGLATILLMDETTQQATKDWLLDSMFEEVEVS